MKGDGHCGCPKRSESVPQGSPRPQGWGLVSGGRQEAHTAAGGTPPSPHVESSPSGSLEELRLGGESVLVWAPRWP